VAPLPELFLGAFKRSIIFSELPIKILVNPQRFSQIKKYHVSLIARTRIKINSPSGRQIR
jgi:hypothetical protein